MDGYTHVHETYTQIHFKNKFTSNTQFFNKPNYLLVKNTTHQSIKFYISLFTLYTYIYNK